MKSNEEILNDFVLDYEFETTQDLKDNLIEEDIMENVISLGEDLSDCDSGDYIVAMKLIDRLKEWQVLYNFVKK